MRQSTEASGSISFLGGSSGGSHLESGAMFPIRPCIWQSLFYVWVLAVEFRIWIFREILGCFSAILGSTVDTCSATVFGVIGTNCTFSSLRWTRNLRSSVSVLSQNGDLCSVDASVRSPVTLLALGIWTLLSWSSRGCLDHA